MATTVKTLYHTVVQAAKNVLYAHFPFLCFPLVDVQVKLGKVLHFTSFLLIGSAFKMFHEGPRVSPSYEAAQAVHAIRPLAKRLFRG